MHQTMLLATSLTIDVADAVGKSALFRGLGPAELDRIVASAGCRKLPRGAMLFQQGSEPAELYLLSDGWIKMTHVTRNGDQIALRFMQRGDHVDGDALFRNIKLTETETTESDA